MDRYTLFDAMVNSRQITLTKDNRPVTGRIQWIQMEDGSGYSFNVGLLTARGGIVAYVRCNDPLTRSK